MFLTITSGRSARAIIYEPSPCDYLWLECWVSENRRDGEFVKVFVKSALRSLAGTHHLHYFPGIKSFSELARELSFTRHGLSRLFEGCVARRHRVTESESSPDIRIARSEQLPMLRVAKTLEEGKKIVCLAQKNFERRSFATKNGV